MKLHHRPAMAALFLLSACSASDDLPSAPSATAAALGAAARVTISADAGPGSLRQALADANANPSISAIHIAAGLGAIVPQQPLVYSGPQSLAIRGGGVELDGSGLATGQSLFTADGGASLSVSDLTVQNAPANGILISVPGAATGTLTYDFARVTVRGNGRFGVLINDQQEFLNDPESTSQEGSDAGIIVRLADSRIERNGLGALDNDGFRVNEGGLGGIEMTALGTNFTGNGADGLELDERAAGDAALTLQQAALTRNGAFDVATDPDDGVDVDESGDGSIFGRFIHVNASDNSEQGVDLNENDAGDLRVAMTQVEASRNGEEGIEFEEDDDFAAGGDIHAELRDITTTGNGLAGDGDAGLKLREKGAGYLFARVVGARSSSNVGGVGGILFREDAGGDMDAEAVQVAADANDADGIRFQGSGAARLLSASASGNAGQQIRSDAGVVLTQVP